VINKAISKVVVPKRKKIALTKELEKMPSINVDSQAIEMVIFNIISNAFSAIEREGIVRITASVKADNMIIKVADNGVGLSDDFLQNSLFRPFKTTKKTGFGIGLYQCKTIIEAHGGSIEVESALRKGTTFTIRLPLQ
jgi:signal transduction histidine kinase